MGIFRELGKKPWLSDSADMDAINKPAAFFLPAGKVGLRVFLLVVTVFFSLLIVAYADRMVFGVRQGERALATRCC